MARFLIAGAGIGGLTAALTLARAGAKVAIFERAATLRETGAGVQLSPNATRVLSQLGVLDILADVALNPAGIRVRNARSGALIVFMPLQDAQQRWGSPYCVVHRADLQSALVATLKDQTAISLHLDSTIAGFGATDSSVKATVKQGQVTRMFEGDALIGADGIRSTIRSRLIDGADAPREVGRTAWRALLSADAVDGKFSAPETSLWLGHRAHLVHYPLAGGKQINVVAIIQGTSGAEIDTWSAAGDPAVIRGRFGGWHASARALISAAPCWTTWPLFDRLPLAAWNAGRVALLGDAAHPILPFLAQGSAQAIEDAAVLASAVSSTDDVRQALATYSQNRLSRVARIQESSRQLGRIYHLPGAQAAVRNLGMRMLGGSRLLNRYDWLYSA